MTEIFFIAYEFPPLNTGGTFRPLKFVKYFNDFGIKPIVFSLHPDDYSKTFKNKKKDYGLLKEIDGLENEIIYIKTDPNLNTQKKRLLSRIKFYFKIVGENNKVWEKNFFKEVESALLRYSPKVILITAPPFGIIDLAVKLSKKTNIPLIIDMRDSFSMWVSQPYGSYFHYKLTIKKERHWFNHAQKVIAVTEQMINDWKTVHKKIPGNKFHLIPNGTDEKINFSKINITPFKSTFVFGYVGSFYYHPESRDLMFKPWYKKKLHRKLQYTPRKEDWLYRSPYFFFKTLSFLFKTNPEFKQVIFCKFAGIKPSWFDSMVKQFSLKKNVEHLGFLPFEKSIEFQKNCDALLITSTKVIGGDDYCIAGKSFDYITTGKAIVGFVAKGAQKEFLEKTGVSIICNPDNVAYSADTLKNLLEKGINLTPNKAFLEKYHRKSLTKKLSRIILED